MSVRVYQPVRLLFLQCRRTISTTSRLAQAAQESDAAATGRDNSHTNNTASRSSGASSRRSIDTAQIFQAQGGGDIQAATVPYETLAACPDPTCPCAATPTMPEGLPIDMESKMRGVMPYYDRHVVTTLPLPRGTASGGSTPFSVQQQVAAAGAWLPKIEADKTDLMTILKMHLGPKGSAYRPDFSVSVTASTLSASEAATNSRSDAGTAKSEAVWVFPDFVRVQLSRQDGVETADGNTGEHVFGDADLARASATSEPLSTQKLSGRGLIVSSITKPVIFICGHGQRDARCGILGPLLLNEFAQQLNGHPNSSSSLAKGEADGVSAEAHIALISHIGGHKYAGNVVIYMPPPASPPPSSSSSSFSSSPLAGKAVWYGRVEPRHVEGIVKETLRGGRVIDSLLRGVQDFDDPRRPLSI